ncbi:MAG: DUF1573 domain-containing protein [Planctomycetota bacterium]|nr:DUF1573 domain-containing protein [Planctomycetota bacterium]
MHSTPVHSSPRFRFSPRLVPGFLVVGLICSCGAGNDGGGESVEPHAVKDATQTPAAGPASKVDSSKTAKGGLVPGFKPGQAVPKATGKGSAKGQKRKRPQNDAKTPGTRKVPGSSGAHTTRVPTSNPVAANNPGGSPNKTVSGAQIGKPVNDGPVTAGGQNPMAGAEKDPDARLSIEFGAEKHDFGPARQGDILNHTFKLKSTGDNPVRIRQASPTCGCTVSKVAIDDGMGNFGPYKMGDEIPSGREVQIEAALDTSHKTNKTQVRINVYTNDPIGLTQLALTSNIEPFIKATPPFVNMGDIKEGEEKVQLIDIRTSRGEPVMLSDDTSNPIKLPPGMTVDLSPVGPHDDGRSSHWQAKVTVGEGANEGPIGYQIRLNSDFEMPEDKAHTPEGPGPVILGGAKFYKVSASVNGRILGALSFTPQFLSMGLVRPGQVVKRNVKVISHDPSFDLSKATVELRPEDGQELAWKENFSTSLRPAVGLSNAIDVQLVLEGLPDGSDGSFRGVMVILTGHPTKPELAVRFSGVCRAGVGTVLPDRR